MTRHRLETKRRKVVAVWQLVSQYTRFVVFFVLHEMLTAEPEIKLEFSLSPLGASQCHQLDEWRTDKIMWYEDRLRRIIHKTQHSLLHRHNSSQLSFFCANSRQAQHDNWFWCWQSDYLLIWATVLHWSSCGQRRQVERERKTSLQVIIMMMKWSPLLSRTIHPE